MVRVTTPLATRMETPRTPFMKKVRNMGWSDKVHKMAARGGKLRSGRL